MRISLVNKCLFGICLLFSSSGISGQINKTYIDFIPKSPELSAIDQYGNVAVNHATGVPDITIPLHTIEYDGVKIPISISYLATGIKVNDISSSVGLKWMLSAGGAVSRNVIGIMDENPDRGWLYFNRGQVTDTTCNLNILENYYNGSVEATPDVFSYQAGKQSGGFFFDYENNIIKINGQDVKIDVELPIYTDPDYDLGEDQGYISGEENPFSFGKFTITDQHGNRYFYNKDGYDGNYSGNKNESKNNNNSTSIETTCVYTQAFGGSSIQPKSSEQNITAWKIDSIKTPAGKNINFTYEQYEYETGFFLATNEFVMSVDEGATGNTDFIQYKNNIKHNIALNKTIETEFEKVIFTYEEDTSLSLMKKRLKKIEVKGKITGKILKTIIFEHDQYSGDPRLKLTGLKIYGGEADDDDYCMEYGFIYNEGSLPQIGDLKQDIFGYINLNRNDEHMVPLSASNDQLNIFFTPADREVNSTTLNTGVLNAIQYPTGGMTVFSYEPNVSYEPSSIRFFPGLRVARIRDYNIDGAIYNDRRFHYSSPFYGAKSSHVAHNYNDYYKEIKTPQAHINMRRWSSNPYNLQNNIFANIPHESGFFYREVKIENINGGNTKEYYTQYFENFNLKPSLRKRIVFDEHENKVKKETYTYESKQTGEKKWIGTFGRGLVRELDDNWTVYNHNHPDYPSGIVGISTILAVFIDHFGNKWIGTVNGLIKYNGISWKRYYKGNSGLPGKYIQAITNDKSGTAIWFGTNNGLAKLDTLWTVYNTSNHLPNNNVNALATEGFSKLWIGTLGGGLTLYDGSNWTHFNTDNSNIPDDNVNVIHVDDNNNKWIGTGTTIQGSVEGGLAKFDGNNWTVYDTDNGLPGHVVYAVTSDNNGVLWIGTNNGLAKYDGSNWEVFQTTNSDLPNNKVNSIIIDDNNNILIGTSGGLAKFDRINWTIYNTNNSELPNDVVTALAIDDMFEVKGYGTGDSYLMKGYYLCSGQYWAGNVLETDDGPFQFYQPLRPLIYKSLQYRRPIQKEIKEYYNAGTDSLLTTFTYRYNDHGLLTEETRRFGIDSASLTNKYLYVPDLNLDLIYDSENTYRKMLDKHMLAYTIEQKLLKENPDNSNGPVQQQGRITKYNKFSDNIIKPSHEYVFESKYPILSNNVALDDTGSLVIPENYKKRVNYKKYNKYGNLLQYSLEDGMDVTYLWGYYNKYPIAEIKNADYNTVISTLEHNVDELNEKSEEELINIFNDLRTSLSGTIINSYTFKPLIGMSSETDSRGKTTFFDYDKLGRLSKARDNEDFIIAHNKYNYTGPVDIPFNSNYSLTFNVSYTDKLGNKLTAPYGKQHRVRLVERTESVGEGGEMPIPIILESSYVPIMQKIAFSKDELVSSAFSFNIRVKDNENNLVSSTTTFPPNVINVNVNGEAQTINANVRLDDFMSPHRPDPPENLAFGIINDENGNQNFRLDWDYASGAQEYELAKKPNWTGGSENVPIYADDFYCYVEDEDGNYVFDEDSCYVIEDSWEDEWGYVGRTYSNFFIDDAVPTDSMIMYSSIIDGTIYNMIFNYRVRSRNQTGHSEWANRCGLINRGNDNQHSFHTLDVQCGINPILPSGIINEGYTYKFDLDGGKKPYKSLKIINDGLPNGLSLDPTTQTISGIPTEAGIFSFILEITDSCPTKFTCEY